MMLRSTKVGYSCFLILYFPLGLLAVPNATQNIPLSSGWNLVSIQVGQSYAVADVRQNLSNRLVSVWGYDAATRSWQSYQPGKADFPNDLAALVPGRGYWIQVSQSCTLNLTGAVWSGTTTLLPGWNLVGFPGLALGENEQLDLASIFRDQLSRLPQMWTWEGGTAQRFVGKDDVARPPITDLSSIQPGKGYWVYSLDTIQLTPIPAIALPADTDVSPLAEEVPYTGGDPLYVGQLVRYAGTEDAASDLNHNGILDSPYTQDTLIFPEGVSQQGITIANTGAGLMNWSVDDEVSWLSFDAVEGVTASELDSIRLTVNRAGLLPGSYTNAFFLYAGSVQKIITVILQVPTVAGDYRGYAAAQRVNGKDISLGKIDLNLSLFNDSDLASEDHFRAVINRDKALLFPNDVFMNGVFYQGLDFSLTTSFEMLAADRNAPPYTTFTHNTNDTVGYGAHTIIPDRDFNRDGKLDNQSIFPFAIRREVTLLGSRTTADHLEGTYIEAISGALPGSQRIYIEGTFTLDRETLTPTRKSIYSGKTNTVVSIGGSARSSYTNSLTVSSGVRIQGTVVTLNIDFPRPDELDIVLYSPGRLNSYHFGTNVQGSVTFNLTNFNGAIGQGKWELVINWNPLSGERGFFNGWELRLEGLAFFSVAGSVVTTNGQPVPGASVLLSGSNILPRSDTATSGAFTFTDLTENDYYLSISKLGYYSTNRAFSINASNVSLAPIVLTPVTAPAPVVQATPFLGQAPLYVSFTPLIPPATLAALGTNITVSWDFGDGTVATATEAVALAHIYAAPNSYRATLTLSGSLGTTNLVTDYITALAAQANPDQVIGAADFITGGGFIGSLASPMNTVNVLEPTPVTVGTNAGYAFYQESKRDSASFDINRDPMSLTNYFAEDTQFFVQTGTPYFNIGGLVPAPMAQRFRMICTLGGYVFTPETVPWKDNSARVGGFKLQVGRIED